MPTDLEELVLSISADNRQMLRVLKKLEGDTSASTRKVEKHFDQMANKIDARLGGIGKNAFRGLLGGVTAALGVGELIRLTDTWTDLTSRVNLASGSMEKGEEVMGRLGEMARLTYSSLEQTTESYINNSTALKELGYATDDQLNYTEALNNALVISAAKGQRAEAVQNALAKAMAGGKLSGENLNTVLQQGGRVAEALAAGLGVGRNELAALGAQGKITSRDVFKALTSQMQTLRNEAASMPATIADGLQLLRNALLEYVGNADKATGVSRNISDALVVMADNFDKTADVALQLAGVIAGALVGRSLAVMIAKLGLGTQALLGFIRALTAARAAGGLAGAFGGLSAAAGPAGLIIGGAVVGALTLFSSSSSEASASGRRYAQVLTEIENAANNAAPAIENVGSRISEKRKNEIAEDLKTATTSADEARAALIDLFDHMFRNVDLTVISDKQLTELRDLREGFVNGAKSAQDVEDKLQQLASSDPDFKALASTFDPFIAKVRSTIEALTRFQTVAASIGLTQGPSWADSEKVSMSALADMKATNQAFIDSQTKQNALSKEQLAIETEIAKVKKESAAAGAVLTDKQIRDIATANVAANTRRSGESKKTPEPKKTADDRFDNLTQSIYDRIAAMKIEADTTGLVYQEQEKRRMALDLEQEALKFVREEARKKGDTDWKNAKLTPEQIAKIDEASDAYARQADALRLVQEAQGRAEDAAQEFYGTFKSGMIDAITGAQSFSDALSGVLKKLAEMVLNSAFDQLFSGATQSGGWLTGLFKGAGFASGTANTGGVRGQPMGIVHGQEAVIPLPAGGSVPVKIQAPTMPRLQSPANQGGGVHVTVGVDVDGNGNLLPFVKSVSQGEAQRSTAALGNRVPKMVDGRVDTRQSRRTRA